jgi:two-component system response regulator YesN
MDSLELMRAIKEKNKKVKIIILSHYGEFSYAQEAINLGAFRYILKSEMTKTNLLNVLKSLFISTNEEEADSQENNKPETIAAQRERYIESCLPNWKYHALRCCGKYGDKLQLSVFH